MSIKYCLSAGDDEDRLQDDGLGAIFAELSKRFKSEQNLLPVHADYLHASYTRGLAVLALNAENSLVGYSRVQLLLPKLHPQGEWFELGGTWVHPDYRGRRVNEEMYKLLLPRHSEKNILATTTNPISFEVGKRLGLVTVQRRQLPEDVWKASCICPIQKTGSASRDNEGCKFAWGESQRELSPCWFRVTPETAGRLHINA